MVKLVVRLSRLAKVAVLVALVGVGLAVYGKLNDVAWAGGVGTVLLFGGAITYYVERYRMFKGRRGSQEGPTRPGSRE